jgi:phytoene desaturase
MANGVKPTPAQVQELSQSIIARIEARTGTSISNNIVYQRIESSEYFEEAFNAYKGNAFGLAHTLTQSAMFRPRLQSKKLSNLFYVGQYTNPGTGVPMVVLSGKIISRVIGDRLK